MNLEILIFQQEKFLIEQVLHFKLQILCQIQFKSLIPPQIQQFKRSRYQKDLYFRKFHSLKTFKS